MPKKIKGKKRPWHLPSREAAGRVSTKTKFYDTARWRKTSRLYREEHPLCCICEADKKLKPAEVTDHIIPVSMGGAELDPRNFQGLCHTCHNSKSARERHGQVEAFAETINGRIPVRNMDRGVDETEK